MDSQRQAAGHSAGMLWFNPPGGEENRRRVAVPRDRPDVCCGGVDNADALVGRVSNIRTSDVKRLRQQSSLGRSTITAKSNDTQTAARDSHPVPVAAWCHDTAVPRIRDPRRRGSEATVVDFAYSLRAEQTGVYL